MLGGTDIKEAFEQCAMAMFGYMTEIDTVSMISSETIEAEGNQAITFSVCKLFLEIQSATQNFYHYLKNLSFTPVFFLLFMQWFRTWHRITAVPFPGWMVVCFLCRAIFYSKGKAVLAIIISVCFST